MISEVKEFQNKLQWLREYGDRTRDESQTTGASSSGESSSNLLDPMEFLKK
jgi:hypothetical protein